MCSTTPETEVYNILMLFFFSSTTPLGILKTHGLLLTHNNFQEAIKIIQYFFQLQMLCRLHTLKILTLLEKKTLPSRHNGRRGCAVANPLAC